MRNNLVSLFLLVLLGLFLAACPEPKTPSSPDGFWAVNYTTQKYYRVQATKLYEGDKCEVWAEDGSGVDVATAKKFADKYDNEIYDLVMGKFDIGVINYNGRSYANVMEFAKAITGSPKLLILLLDIKDGSNGGSYVAGYFSGINYFSTKDYPNSNLTNMMYIDTNPGLAHFELTCETFAHEFQHLVSFLSAVARKSRQLDTWIDEGMSTMVESFYLNDIETSRYEWFISDNARAVGTLAKGNNFYVWDNHRANELEKNYSILDEYATTYMFFQWLYLQSGKDAELFKNINRSSKSNYEVITELAGQIKNKWNDWDILLGDWLAANYINNPTNEYGYKDASKPDGAFSGLVVSTPMNSGHTVTTLSLSPGEGVYSKVNGSYAIPAGSGVNIKYAGLRKSSATVNNSGSFSSGDVLLSFNADTNVSGTAETAHLTGQPLTSVTIAPASSSLMRTAVPLTIRPCVIDANDIIGRQKTLPKVETQW